MARAAVIPQSPAKRVARTSTKSTAAADAKKKAPRRVTPAPRTATPALDAESDDELGFITSKPAKPTARPPGRPAIKPKATTTVTARGRKASESLADKPKPQNNAGENELGQQTEAPKKRVGRPRKTPLPAEAATTKPEAAPKTRGRPRAATTAKAPPTRETVATSRRTRAAIDTANDTKSNQIRIATNSTTMRSNLLRGPAKKKTVKFQDVSDSEAEEPEVPAAGRRRVATKGTAVGKAGLGATPVRKPVTTGTRGRKPAAAKKETTKPLSPKKAKQVAKSLSAYASSDGEDDELNTIKDDTKDPLRLVVHSPVKHGLETTGLSSPVRRINFTPKKASSFMDENGEPKLPTPKHTSDGIGLSSPVRKINFAPNRSQNTVADNGHLALPPGNSVIFSDSMIMSSPARRPAPSSPFQFSMRETPNRGGSLFGGSVNPISAPDFTPGRTSPLKMSPKKGYLGASFSQSPFKDSTSAAPARTPLFQSPAKRIASPFKNSIFSAHASVGPSNPITNDGTPSKTVESTQSTTPRSSPRDSLPDEAAFEKDTEMVEDVARDIFGIELSSDGKASSVSPIQEHIATSEIARDSFNDENTDCLSAEVEVEGDSDLEEDERDHPQDKAQFEYEEPETICFDVMEEANMATEDLYDEEPEEDSGPGASEQPEDQAQFDREEADTICFDAMEDAQLAAYDLHDQQVQEASDLEEAQDAQDESEFEYEELDTVCFDTMEDAQLAAYDLHHQEIQEASELEEGEDLYEGNEFEYEEADTVCFDTMEDAQFAAHDLHHHEVQEASEPEEGEDLHDESEFEYEEADTVCFDTMEDAHRAENVLYDEQCQVADSDMDTDYPEDELAILEQEIEEESQNGQEAIQQPEEEGQVMGEQSDVEDTESILAGPEFATLSPNPASPRENNHAEDITTPAQRTRSIALPQSSPTGGESTPLALNCPANSENGHDSTLDAKNANNVIIDAPLHEENSSTPNTQVDSPALTAPSLFNTPSVIDQHQSPAESSLGFTPLAQKFGRWEQNTPSQARSLRPRRRGVFSLVGPLDRTNTETPTNSESVSYPNLSKSPLAHTPSLFAQSPLQPQSACISPEYEHTPRASSIYEDHQIIDSPNKSTDIFEDPDSEIIELEHTSAAEVPQDRGQEFHLLDDKENCGPILPSTPMKAQTQPDELRTIHTVSKVPLKAEGDVSPLKLPRKRGLSLSSTSPTRSSPRVRKPTFMALNDTAPVLSPSRKSPRVSRSPAPKRRSITSRRSSVKAPAMAAPGTPVATASPAKKARRSMSTEQKALHGAVVHVDVHTTEGEDASGIFVELLQQMGARCVKSWSWNPRSSLSPVDGAEPKDLRVGITHVVYKDGGLRTMEKVKKAAGLVKCVGVGWVLDCERENQWLDETPYAVDSSIIPRGGAKRRKSMEPRALSNVNGTLVRISESPAPSAGGRRSGVNPGAVEGFRKITPPTHQPMPSTPPQQSSADSYQFPATPGYNFANLDAIGMSPATPGFLGNRSKLVQQSCPPKQSNRGLFPSAKPASITLDEGQDEESRRQRRFRMEAARRKSLVYKPAVASPLVP
ncbi:BRCT [Penicillium camemberti]|uniref:BRCT n=1 Tax=Penicillium camemberti (strain FM 013) TaxID=1429867 RepID=A0A0G4NTT0_PENC3|nr:BRCT [Penicillium camemberti]